MDNTLIQHIEQKLHFSQVRNAVESYCVSDLGKHVASKMHFSTNEAEVNTTLLQTNEMLSLFSHEKWNELPCEEFNDIEPSLKRIRIAGLYLEEDELCELYIILNTIGKTLTFFNSLEEGEYMSIRQTLEDIQQYPLLCERIEHILGKDGKIKDNATPHLGEIRKEIRLRQQQMQKRIGDIMKQLQVAGIVEADSNVTIRDGRAVIPVASANKRSVRGIVHDESATGKTSYIEPEAIVSLGNEVRELEIEEKREIIRILTDLSNNIRPHIDDIIEGIEVLAFIDFLRAKARYAYALNARLPQIDRKGGVYIYNGRHPLLYMQLKAKGQQIVPLSIELKHPNSKIIVISGPNAGGKSICLQTIGILQYMLQCGLLVPVEEGSRFSLFDKILIDMGDEQSLENDLSTYSSHLTNMKYFMRVCNNKTMILIDEFGTGTEPIIGGAIAEATLGELNRCGAWGVITTHYSNLKTFASETPGLLNAAMLFDTEHIEPLFKLRMGQPGSSFAMEIANKIGLPKQVLAKAKEIIGSDRLDYDKHLREIIRDKNYYETKREQIHQAEKRLAEQMVIYEKHLAELKKERKEILERAKHEAKNLIAESRSTIENTIREIKEADAKKEETRLAREKLEKFQKEQLEEEKKRNADEEYIQRQMQKIKNRQERKQNKQNKNDDITIKTKEPEIIPVTEGTTVCIDGNKDRTGTVLKIKGNEALIAMGNLQTNIKLNRLTVVSKGEIKRAQQTNSNIYYTKVMESVREKKLNFKPEIDVRGMRADEAIETVANFVDEAIICDQSRLRILHGKGNGILRIQIRQYLQGLKEVKHIADEDIRLGGSGITIVEL